MDVLKVTGQNLILACLLGLSLTQLGCQLGYYAQSAYHQGRLLSSRVPLEKALQDPTLSETTRHKLQLAQSARQFAEDEMGLARTKNYTSFVQLDGPHVSYIVHAAPKTRLEHHLWRFPIVGALPYKGYFQKQRAEAEAKRLQKRDLDTFVRGVTAYSTLGWFRDPILSSMLRSQDHRLVNLIIHETVHATVFIKSNADFNERLATFLGNLGTELYYLQLEGPDSETLKQISAENHDHQLFSDFISSRLEELKIWYESVSPERALAEREEKFSLIQEAFKSELAPQLKTNAYLRFSELNLNNALLLSYKTYYYNLDDFQQLYDLLDRNLEKYMSFFVGIQRDPQPQLRLEQKIETLQNQLSSTH